MQQILIVEDDRTLSMGLCKALKNTNCFLTPCHNLKDAREQLAMGGISLVLLDIELPDGSGLDFLQEIKYHIPELPVILLTANDTDMDIVDGLEKGADDYITKPFSLAVLRARINTQLRKVASIPKEDKFYSQRFLFNFTKMQYFSDGNLVELSKTEQKLLRLLIENQGITMSRDQLIQKIWSSDDYVDENALSVTIKRLRDKLNARNEIKTVYGIGYLWGKENEKP